MKFEYIFCKIICIYKKIGNADFLVSEWQILHIYENTYIYEWKWILVYVKK